MIKKGGKRVNTMKVTFSNLFQTASSLENEKVSSIKSDTFDTVMKQSVKKTVKTDSKKNVSAFDKATVIKDTKVSEKSLQDIQTGDNTKVENLKTDTIGKDVISEESMDKADSSKNVMETVDVNKTESIIDNILGKNVLTNTEEAVEIKVEDILKTEISAISNDEPDTLIEDIESFFEQIDEQLQNIIKKDMKLDKEDIQKVLEQIGISITGLLDTSNLQQFVLQNAGEEVGALLTNETLAEQYNQLLTDVNEMCMELENNWNISKPDVKVLSFMVENEQIFQDIDKGNSTVLEMSNMLEEVGSSNEKLMVLLEKVAGMQKGTLKETVIEDLNTNIASDIEQVENRNVSDSEQILNVSSEENFIIVEKENMQKDAGHSEQQQSNSQQQTKENIVTQFAQELLQVRTEVEGTVFNQSEQLQQMREIITQVVEQIKITIKPDVSAMEIQLNPEKLGKVNLSVVSKNGQLTANFVTENEMAKTALESQIQQLKDAFQNQGLKVDAIEVSVSDFRFEQSSNMNEEQQRQQSDSKKKTQRKIDISMLDDGFDDLSEADTLAAQVMLDNGNTVDYTA